MFARRAITPAVGGMHPAALPDLHMVLLRLDMRQHRRLWGRHSKEERQLHHCINRADGQSQHVQQAAAGQCHAAVCTESVRHLLLETQGAGRLLA